MLWFPTVYTTHSDGKCSAEVYDSETKMVIGNVKAGPFQDVYTETEKLLSFVRYVSESPELLKGYVFNDQEKGEDEPGL